MTINIALKDAEQPIYAFQTSEPLVSIEQAERSFVYRHASLWRKARTFKAVDNVSLKIAKGETLAVVGESGCGKSTLGRLAGGIMRPTAGRIRFDDIDFASLSEDDWRASRQRVQFIFQNAAGSLDPRIPVSHQVREPLDLHNMGSRKERRDKTAEMLQAVKLGEHLWQAVPSELSGGQLQRVVIARALIMEPDFLICDEPVSALDVSIQAQVISMLSDLREKMHLTMMFISHDLAVVRQISDRVAVMYLGQIVESGPSDAIFARPQHPYTKALLSAVPVPDPQFKREKQLLQGDPASPQSPPSGCRFHPRCPHAFDLCRMSQPAIRQQGAAEVACHLEEKDQ